MSTETSATAVAVAGQSTPFNRSVGFIRLIGFSTKR
jgi:hypothetical protein